MTNRNRLTALLVSTCTVITLLSVATGVMAAKIPVTDIDIPNQTTLEPSSAESIEVTYTVEGDLPENTLHISGTKQLTVSTAPAEENAGTDFIWTSSDDSIATADEAGIVTAKAASTATITASNEMGQSAQSEVTVVNAPEKTSASASTSESYYGFVKGEPGVSADFVRDVNDYYMMIPANLRSHYENNGGAITVAATNLAPRWGYSGTVKGVFHHETFEIWIDYRNVAKMSVLHEMAHYLDQMLGFIADGGEFYSIWSSEANTFRSVWSCSTANTSTPHEYFVEAFKACITNPSLMQQNCPQTYTFLMDCAYSL